MGRVSSFVNYIGKWCSLFYWASPSIYGFSMLKNNIDKIAASLQAFSVEHIFWQSQESLVEFLDHTVLSFYCVFARLELFCKIWYSWFVFLAVFSPDHRPVSWVNSCSIFFVRQHIFGLPLYTQVYPICSLAPNIVCVSRHYPSSGPCVGSIDSSWSMALTRFMKLSF